MGNRHTYWENNSDKSITFVNVEQTSVYNYKDIIYSCFLPAESLSEYRLLHHALIYVYSGEIQLKHNGLTSHIRAGEYVFLRRDHRLHIHKHTLGSDPYKAISIRFDRCFLRDYFRTLDNGAFPQQTKRFREAAIKIPSSPYIEGLFTSLFPFTNTDIRPDDDFVQLKMREAMHCLLQTDKRFYPTLFDFNEPWKIDLLQFMEQNCTQDMSLSEFAAYTGRSLATFKRDFSGISDLPPQKWLIQKRLETAFKLICNEGRRVTDVYMDVGFKNRSHFTVAFKRQYGIAPGSIANIYSGKTIP